MDENELSKFNLENQISQYAILNPNLDLTKKLDFYRYYIGLFRQILGENNFDQILRILSSILILNLNVDSPKWNDRFNIIKKLLNFGTDDIISFFLKANKPVIDEDLKKRINSTVFMLYSIVVKFLIKKINLLTKNGAEIDGYECIEFIDSVGFIELNRYEDFSEDNKFSEFVSNYLNEKIFELFVLKRYKKEQELFKKENLDKFIKNVFFVDNDDILKSIERKNGLLDKISKFNNFDKLKEALKEDFDIFLKKTYNLLNKELTKDNKNLIYYISLKHYYSEIVNYDLKNIMDNDKTDKSVFDELIKIFSQNDSLKSFTEDHISILEGSRLKYYSHKFEKYFENYRDDSIHFFGTLKITQIKNEIDINMNLFKQFDGIDFESQIERFKNNYPYRVSYDYLLDKFNLMTTIVQINLNLAVDYKQFIQGIIKNMFGENYHQKVLLGENNLYLKENFFFEFNELLNELKNEKSRLRVFIEKSLKNLLEEHCHNSNKIISFSQNFLLKNCVLTKFEKLKKAKSHFLENFRKKWRKKVAHSIVLDILNKIEYYNLAKVIRVQAMVRGVLTRLKLKLQLKKLKTFQFNRKVSLITKKLKNTLNIFLKLKQEQRSYLNSEYFLKMIINIGKLEIEFINKLRKQDIMRNYLRNAVYKMRMIRLAKVAILDKIAHIKIYKFLKQRQFVIKIQEKIHNRKVQKIVKKEKKLNEIFVENCKNLILKNNLKNIFFNFFLKKKNQLLDDKMELYFQNFSLKSLSLDNNIKNLIEQFLSLIQNLQSQKDNILFVNLQNDSLIIVTKKNFIYVLKPNKNNMYTIKITNKILKIGLYQNHLLFLNEDMSLDTRDILIKDNKNVMGNLLDDIENDEYFTDQVKSTKFKITDFKSNQKFFIMSTYCKKLLFQIDYEKKQFDPLTFQFKRPIIKVSIGEDFFMALDKGGVLYSYGNNSRGQLGAGLNRKGLPKKQNGLAVVVGLAKKKETIRSFDCGEKHTIVVTHNGKIFGWGDNFNYQLTSDLSNHLGYIAFPRIISSQMFGHKNIKYDKQIKCGRFSTYILFENKKLFAFGKLGISEILKKPKLFDLKDLGMETTIPVSLNVKFNNNLELVYLKCINMKQGNMTNLASFKKFGKLLFDLFMINENSVLHYNKVLAQNLSLKNLSSKLFEVNFTKEKNIAIDLENDFFFCK